MSIPSETTVLVVGGGPGGSYAATALAREGIDVVVLEAELFPRYHVGESMVPSIRHFMRFIDLDKTMDNYGFNKKTGAAFKLNNKRDAYTDFIVAIGPNDYAWNVIRSELDDLMFKYAGKCGARTFDGVKVKGINFVPSENTDGPDIGQPVSAIWSRKDGSSGEIKFKYIVDASGRAGIVSTKYMKNRSFNSDLKNVASWGYWKGAISYGVGTPKEGQPYFEALQDGSGWAWLIPLHNGTTSVGVVMNQALSTSKKQETNPVSGTDFYRQSIQEARGVAKLLSEAELVTEIKHASDWSYYASTYASPYLRIVGDAGAFIDPYFSSGVHLALSGALSAAATICAAIRGDCDESTAWKWHSNKVNERYTRFLYVVLSATKQIRQKDVPVLHEDAEGDFDNAFSIIRPVIQGMADVNGKASKEEITEVLEFTRNAIESKNPSERHPWIEKENGDGTGEWLDVKKKELLPEEAHILKAAHGTFKDYFAADEFAGLVARLERGSLGLIKSKPGGQVDNMNAVVDQKLPAADAKVAEVVRQIPGVDEKLQEVGLKVAEVVFKLLGVDYKLPAVDLKRADVDHKLPGIHDDKLSEVNLKRHEFATNGMGETIRV